MEILFLLGLGLVAGTLGGLLGIGGSVIMIPALTIILDWQVHLAQAVAMTINPAVAASAALKHHQNHNISWTAVKRVLPISVVCICVAAWLSNSIDGAWLELSFGCFLIWVLWDQITYLAGKSSHDGDIPSMGMARCGLTGGVTGTTAGFLGIGGGLIQVPLLNNLCKIPMKNAIGTSSAIMLVTAIIGATVKDASLVNSVNEFGDSNGLQAMDAIINAAWLLPGALLGGWFGAKLTNVLPVKNIRIAFAVLVVLAAIEMLTGAGSALFGS
jgi:uncharacterized membrane protein YfcA